MSKSFVLFVLLLALSIVVGCSSESTDVAETEKPVFLPEDEEDEPEVNQPAQISRG